MYLRKGRCSVNIRGGSDGGDYSDEDNCTELILFALWGLCPSSSPTFLKRPLFFMRLSWRFISLFLSIAGRSGVKEAMNVRSQKL